MISKLTRLSLRGSDLRHPGLFNAVVVVLARGAHEDAGLGQQFQAVDVYTAMTAIAAQHVVVACLEAAAALRARWETTVTWRHLNQTC